MMHYSTWAENGCCGSFMSSFERYAVIIAILQMLLLMVLFVLSLLYHAFYFELKGLFNGLFLLCFIKLIFTI